MGFKLLIYHQLPEEALRRLRDGGVEVIRGYHKPTEAGICRDIPGCDALVAFEQPEHGFNQTIIDAAGESLKLIARRGVGYETVDVAYAEAQGIYVTNTPRINHVTVAEATVMMMLECARNAQKAAERFRALRGDYPFFTSDPTQRGFELRGRTAGLIGCGNIGREVGKILSAGFGMRVIGYDPLMPEFPPGIHRVDSAEAVWEQADFVSLHLPATPETRGSVGMEQFRRMKSSAFLINAARGEIVREDELIQALREGIIRGAGLDSYSREPIPESSYELFELERVVLYPHNASFTVESLQNAIGSVVKSVLEVAAGKAPEFAVNNPPAPRLRRSGERV